MRDKAVDPVIIKFLSLPATRLTDHASFAHFIGERDECQRVILNRLGAGHEALRDDPGQKMLLMIIWSEAQAHEKLRLDHLAKGTGSNDLEEPLPDGDFNGDGLRMVTEGCNWEMCITERLCEPLYGRCKRETKKGFHTVIPLDRVRSAADINQHAVGNTLPMDNDVHITV